ncbi:MAG: response regulator [Thiovulaceae bacterium]|nr:response regulator [Sulfurimonadaceae bacterium]MCW9026616.1 response regulator [Sulfurimonadaceae bacterium]
MNNTNLTKQNILIIDDNHKNIQVAANVLKSTNLYNIFFATNGEKGIEQLSIRAHSLILLDINMPGIDGYETARRIKQDSKYKKIPIIFLSANANKESIRKGFENGGEDYITKPFDESELIHRVKTHVELFLSKEKLQNEVDETHLLLEQYKEAVDQTSLVSKADANGTITYTNDMFCKISQYSRDELIGKKHSSLVSPEMQNMYKDLWDAVSNKKTWKGLLKNIAKDGSYYYVDTTVIPILNSNGDILEYISLRNDVTSEVKLKDDILATQREILYTLGELGERRSQETGEHVSRVANFSELLAKKYGCKDSDVEELKMASPMHDIGKVAIADKILLKASKLTYEEFEEMKLHTLYGWNIFKNSKQKLLKTVALISHQHHEKWDGTGYPSGLKGEEIHIFGRITSVADVFDALTHDRVYKKAWSVEEALEFIKSEKGKSFEPRLVDILVENIDEFIAIQNIYKKS